MRGAAETVQGKHRANEHGQGWHRPSEHGQGTVEFAVVTAAFLVVSLACAALWHAIGDGLLVGHAATSASHHVAEAMPGNIADIFLY